MTKQYVDKEEQIRNQEEFTYWQNEYNKTGDVTILWEHLEPLFRKAAGPNILKINKFHYVKNFDEKVDNAVLLIMERYKKKPEYNFGSLVTLMYWAAVSVCHNKNTVAEEMTSFYSYEDLIDKGMHEEHVLSMEFEDIGSALTELREGETDENRRIEEVGPQTRVCNYRAISIGKNRVFICSGLGTGKTAQGKSYKCKLRTRREPESRR